MEISTQFKRNESIVREYYTSDINTYDRAEDAQGTAFIENRQQGNIWLNRENARPRTECSRRLTLSELLTRASAPSTGEGFVTLPQGSP